MQVVPSKAPGETVPHRWEPELDYNESFETVSVTVDDGTVTVAANDETFRGGYGVTLLISGGEAGETARFSVDGVTSRGRTLTGVFLIGVLSEAPILAPTAGSICRFALRKVAGNGNVPSADEIEDALERLNDLIALWRMQSADIGVAKVLEAGDVLDIPDGFVSALKFCLRRDLHDFYGVALSALDVQRAADAEAAVLAKTIQFQDLPFERALLPRAPGWDYARGY